MGKTNTIERLSLMSAVDTRNWFQITPSIFEEVNVGDNLNKIVDEYTYATLVDKDLAAQRLERLLNLVIIHCV